MTEPHRQENIRLELERARGALNAARILLEQGEYADSVSRSYYAMLHHARAVLLLEDLEPKSHGGVGHCLNLRFVRPGLFPVAEARVLTRLQAEREVADYDRTAVFDETTAREVLDAALQFCAVCIRLLGEQGYPDA